MNEEKAREIAISIQDEFEELLAAKGIIVPSDDREGREEEACLHGTEYYEMEDAVVGVLMGEVREDEGFQAESARRACCQEAGSSTVAVRESVNGESRMR